MLAYECGISELFVDVFIGLKSSKDITVPGNVDNFSFGSALLIYEQPNLAAAWLHFTCYVTQNIYCVPPLSSDFIFYKAL